MHSTNLVSFKDLADELKISRFELARIRDEKLSDEEHTTIQGKKWFTQEGAEKVRLAVAVPLAVPKRIRLRAVKAAPNPHWIYCIPETGLGDKVLVAVKPSWCDRLVGKLINVDVIEDANGGKTYRHETLGGK
jgi:hypothetical protein